MTTVFVRRDERGVAGLTVSGHAGYAAAGSDIVCAAISSLISTCANALESVAGVQPAVLKGAKGATISVNLPKGISGERAHDAQIIMQTVLQGFSDVALQYPKNLQIK